MFRLDLGRYSTKGGFLSPTLASILYQTALGDFVYQTDSNGNVVLDNQGTLTSAYDGQAYSGRGIELGATNDVDIPIHHTLGLHTITGAFTYTVAADEIATFTNSSTTSFTIDVTTSGTNTTRPYITPSSSSLVSIGDRILISFDIVSTGTVAFSMSCGGASVSKATYTSGTYSFEVTATTTYGGIAFAFDGTNICTAALTNISVKQITNPNSYLTYYDFTDGLVTLGNSVDGGSSDNANVVTNGTFDTDVSSWTDVFGVSSLIYQSGQARANADQTVHGYRQICLEIGKTYKVTAQLTNVNATNLNADFHVQLGSVSSPNVAIGVGETYIFEFSGVADGTNLDIRGTTSSLDASMYTLLDNVVCEEILPISTKYTLNTKTVNNIITHTTPWSASDWTKINNNPNLIGKLALETTGATKTIPELDMVMDAGASADSYHMCSEKSGAYLVDSRVAYGAELVTNGGFDTDTAWTKQDTWQISGGTGNTSAPLTIAASIFQQNLTVGDIYIATATLVVSAGTCQIRAGNTFSPDITSSGTYTYLLRCSSTEVNGIRGLAGFSGSVDDISYRKATATEIANYADTVRTNADLQQKGIQQTAFVTDGAGVPTSYSSNLLQFNGDGRHVDTWWIPSASEDWTIESVFKHSTDTSRYKLSGIWGAGNDKVVFGSDINGSAYFYRVGSYIGAAVTSGLSVGGLNHIVLAYDSSEGTITRYMNNGVGATNATVYVMPSMPFYIGEAIGGSSFELDEPIGIFKIHKNKAMDATEVTTAYANAKAIYPSLP